MHALLFAWMLMAGAPPKPTPISVAENDHLTVIVAASHLYVKSATTPFWYRFALPFLIARVGIDAKPSSRTAFKINESPAVFHEADGTLTIGERDYEGTRPALSTTTKTSQVGQSDWRLREGNDVVEIIHRDAGQNVERRYTLKLSKQ